MATFYGQLTGNRGTATRTGSNASGIESSLQSYNGSVQTLLSYDARTGALMVELSTAEGSSNRGNLIFRGTIGDLVEMCETYTAGRNRRIGGAECA